MSFDSWPLPGRETVVVYEVVCRSSTALVTAKPYFLSFLEVARPWLVQSWCPIVCPRKHVQGKQGCRFVPKWSLMLTMQKVPWPGFWPAVSCWWCVSDQVTVQYRTKVVKYTWPKSHQVADSIPWVQVSLANGETVQTKLLVSETPHHITSPFTQCNTAQPLRH